MTEHIKLPNSQPQLRYPEGFDSILQAFQTTTIPDYNIPLFVSHLRYEAHQRQLGRQLRSPSAEARNGLFLQLWLTTFLEHMRHEVPGFRQWHKDIQQLQEPHKAVALRDGTVQILENKKSIMEFDALTVYDDYNFDNSPFYTIWEIKAGNNKEYIKEAFAPEIWEYRVNKVKELFNAKNVGYVIASTQDLSVAPDNEVLYYSQNGGKIVHLPSIFGNLQKEEAQMSEWELQHNVEVPLVLTTTTS